MYLASIRFHQEGKSSFDWNDALVKRTKLAYGNQRLSKGEP